MLLGPKDADALILGKLVSVRYLVEAKLMNRYISCDLR
jgi:hypothetical protein